jgi:hypothetical protein
VQYAQCHMQCHFGVLAGALLSASVLIGPRSD